jgi:serine/threonine protein kinase
MIGVYEHSEYYELVLPWYVFGCLLNLLRKDQNPTTLQRYTGLDRLNILTDVARGMSHLWKRNIAHCDLAARNVIVDSLRGSCKISDFGSASEAGDINMWGPGVRDHRVSVTHTTITLAFLVRLAVHLSSD